MRDPIENFIESAEFLGEGHVLSFDSYSYRPAEVYKLYRSQNCCGRILAVRKIHRKRWRRTGFLTWWRFDTGQEMYDSMIVPEYRARKMLMAAGNSYARAARILGEQEEKVDAE